METGLLATSSCMDTPIHAHPLQMLGLVSYNLGQTHLRTAAQEVEQEGVSLSSVSVCCKLAYELHSEISAGLPVCREARLWKGLFF